MAEVPFSGEQGTQHLDVCTLCQFVWFDAKEYEALPPISKNITLEEPLPLEVREELALLKIETIRNEGRGSDWHGEPPDEWWKWIPGLFGMPVEHEGRNLRREPWLTWAIALLILSVSAMAFGDLQNMVQRFGLVPAHVWRYRGITLFTSFFLHAGIFHLLGNLYFFLIFGDNVEDWLGKWRFSLLLVLSLIAGDIVHVVANPNSTIPCIGASGSISGIMTYYALKFPRARIGLLMRLYFWFRWIRMPAYAMFLLWLATQFFGVYAQLAGFSNVSSLAHLGGASVGFFFWLLTRKE